MKEKLLFNAPSPPEAGILCGILDENGIPYYTVTPGPGAIYAASVNMGVRIFVSEEDYERAFQLTDGCLDAGVELVDFPGDVEAEPGKAEPVEAEPGKAEPGKDAPGVGEPAEDGEEP
ncbi:MAG: hypothetical protein BWY35_00141 [Firmicutes bacterium ADurb.Bin248]|nr:MAG: hypothetical protein BWY35_00141 [Firmicutes bacterium ADurb.Bin248]HOG01295.1 DUF2007 domain-containing protein [Clostridia bacterium]